MNRAAIRAVIASHQRNRFLKLLARGADKYLRVYNNQCGWDVRFNGEKNALRLVTTAVPGDVFDVGANAGQWATMALGVIGDKLLHSFEVSPIMYQELQSNVRADPRVTLNDFGLGSEASVIDFYFCVNCTTRSSHLMIDDGYAKVKSSVSIVSGDEYVNQKHIGEIAYLKLDVEGMEMDVLRGFSNCLASGLIHAVQFEHGTCHVITRHLLRDFVDFFRLYGFEVCRIFPNFLVKLQYNHEKDESFIGENFLALQPALLDRLPAQS